MHVCMYVFLQYLNRLTQFSLKLVKLWACINNDKTRTQHRELRSLLFARKVWVLQCLLLNSIKYMQKTGPTFIVLI